jgi:hypothetical protein
MSLADAQKKVHSVGREYEWLLIKIEIENYRFYY